MTRAWSLLAAAALIALASAPALAKAPPKKPTPKEAPPPKEAPLPPPPPAPPPEPEPSTPPPKTGDMRRIVAILDVHVGDSVPAETATQFQKDLDAKLDSKLYWLAPRKRVHEMLAASTKWADGCLVGDCLHEVRAQTGADVVLLASLSGSGTSFASVITLVRTDNGRPLSQMVDRCEVCTLSEALGAATGAAAKLLKALPTRLPDESAQQREALAAATDLERRVSTLEKKQHHRALGLTMTLAGVAAAAVGAAIYSGHEKQGLATAAAGAGLAVGGVVVLTF